MGWANRLTVGRAGLAILLWGLLAAIGNGHDGNAGLWWASFAVFLVAAATDSLDGYIARRLNEVSAFGRVADPLVDKMLILGSLVFLLAIPGVRSLMPPWVAVVILMRELLVTALRGAVEAGGGNFQAAWWGKVKMVIQCVAVSAVLLHGAGIEWLRTPFPALVGLEALPGDITWPWFFSVLAAVVTAGSGVEYAVRAVVVLRAGPARRSPRRFGRPFRRSPVRRVVLSAFGLGFLPAVPGTWASAATALAVVLVGREIPWPIVAPLAATLLGSLATLALSRPAGGAASEPADPSWVVTDEVAGQGLAMIPAAILPTSGWVAPIAAFLLFRVFDIWKPGPIRRLEALPGGLGVLADDLAAGAAAGVLVAVGCVSGAFGGA